MYKLIVAISILIRQFYLPNPFEALGDGLIVNIGETPMAFPPEILNWIAEPFMHVVTFAVVGLYYDRGSAPALGSFLYLLFYLQFLLSFLLFFHDLMMYLLLMNISILMTLLQIILIPIIEMIYHTLN